MSNTADLLRGIAALLWPVALVVLVLVFQDDVRRALRRLRHARLFGQEVDLDKELDDLGSKTAAAQAETPPAAEAAPTQDADEREAIRIAGESPRAALMLVSAELEREMRLLLASGDHLPKRPLSLREMAQELARVAGMSPQLPEAVREFSEVRNRIVHGSPGVDEREVLRAVDLGLSLLRVVHAAPREVFVVEHADVEVFSDPAGKDRLPDVSAVILVVESSDGSRARRVWPTTRSGYKPGQHVTFEWNPTRTWGQCWYRDPETHQVLEAWTSSAEFVGRPLEEV